ncbi:right-handed parallel beta-helix repeat-containing protein [Neobacillus sp.]|uniref:right-handed parallel beta-helix repeat-containing protein n=1 Tax=Neobacillus sp. TaxID=2675273 RepID=UPI002897D79B|nr:right-handed parallel beta-helix repeat-containing protein [Neobacillus sp.]
MRVVVKLFFMAVMISLLGGKEAFAEASLQSQINALPEGAVLKLQEGIYDEEIVLKRPIVLEGEKGTIFKSCSSKPVLTITGKKVSLKHIKIVGCQKAESSSAIYLSGKQHQLEDITIEGANLGMKLDEVKNSRFRAITITGRTKANGFDLWESHHNTFEGIQIDHVQDGFYMENSHYNTFRGNTINDSRYGLHVMFSDNITASKNVSARNFTGAMVMGTHHSVFEDNQLIENNQNVNAQGLLLFDVHDSTVRRNRISDNRVGMFIEDSSGNKMVGNEFSANFVGAQMNRIEKNVIKGNAFISNVNDFQATDGTDNTIQKNYWDAALKLDTDGDGMSNLAYSADPFFLHLTMETPPYQLFFQHPGMMLLQKMLKSPEELLVTDKEPLMKNELKNHIQPEQQRTIFWFICLAMIFASLLVIYFGRKKT